MAVTFTSAALTGRKGLPSCCAHAPLRGGEGEDCGSEYGEQRRAEQAAQVQATADESRHGVGGGVKLALLVVAALPEPHGDAGQQQGYGGQHGKTQRCG